MKRSRFLVLSVVVIKVSANYIIIALAEEGHGSLLGSITTSQTERDNATRDVVVRWVGAACN